MPDQSLQEAVARMITAGSSQDEINQFIQQSLAEAKPARHVSDAEQQVAMHAHEQAGPARPEDFTEKPSLNDALRQSVGRGIGRISDALPSSDTIDAALADNPMLPAAARGGSAVLRLAKAHPVATGAMAAGMAAAPFTAGASIPAAAAATGLLSAGGAGLAIAGRQLATGTPEPGADTVQTMAAEGVGGALGDGVGSATNKLVAKGAKGLYRVMLRPSIPLQREFGDVTAQGLKEGARVSVAGHAGVDSHLADLSNTVRNTLRVKDAEMGFQPNVRGFLPAPKEPVALGAMPVPQGGTMGVPRAPGEVRAVWSPARPAQLIQQEAATAEKAALEGKTPINLAKPLTRRQRQDALAAEFGPRPAEDATDLFTDTSHSGKGAFRVGPAPEPLLGGRIGEDLAHLDHPAIPPGIRHDPAFVPASPARVVEQTQFMGDARTRPSLPDVVEGPGVMLRTNPTLGDSWRPGQGAGQMVDPGQIATQGLSEDRALLGHRALGEEAQAELDALRSRFLAQHDRPMSLVETQQLKTAEQKVSDANYHAEQMGHPVNAVEGQFHKGIASGARQAIEDRAPSVKEWNAHSQNLIGVKRALEDAMRRNLPGVGNIRTLMGAFLPSVGSTVAIGADRASRVPAAPVLKAITALLTEMGYDTGAAPEAAKPGPSATFAFTQPDAVGGPGIKMYHIDGGPHHRSTVSADTLHKLGIDVPPDSEPPNGRRE